jgi:hypothetical protein
MNNCLVYDWIILEYTVVYLRLWNYTRMQIVGEFLHHRWVILMQMRLHVQIITSLVIFDLLVRVLQYMRR